MASAMDTFIKQTGQCFCGAVRFQVEGQIIFNELCHCRACGRARGMTPVHLIGVEGTFSFQKGEELMKMIPGMGSMIHAICRECGSGLYQRPQDENFYAVFPTTFQIEDGLSCLLPDIYRAQRHVNYENRLQDSLDELPKYKAFTDGPMMTNTGAIICHSERVKWQPFARGKELE